VGGASAEAIGRGGARRAGGRAWCSGDAGLTRVLYVGGRGRVHSSIYLFSGKAGSRGRPSIARDDQNARAPGQLIAPPTRTWPWPRIGVAHGTPVVNLSSRGLWISALRTAYQQRLDRSRTALRWRGGGSYRTVRGVETNRRPPDLIRHQKVGTRRPAGRTLLVRDCEMSTGQRRSRVTGPRANQRSGSRQVRSTRTVGVESWLRQARLTFFFFFF
jgi:hypothetical protein